MKKIIKFLAPVSAVVAATTPLMVSCGEKGPTYEYDLTKEFKPTIEQRGGTLSQTTATKTYLEAVKKDTKIFADDLSYVWYFMWGPASGVTKLTLTPYDINPDKSYLSIRVIDEGKQTQGEKLNFRTEYDIRNFPLVVSYHQQSAQLDAGWSVFTALPDDDTELEQYLLTNSDWSYYEKDIIESQGTVEHSWNSMKLSQAEEGEQGIAITLIYAGVLSFYNTVSYYLQNTDPAK